VRTSGRTELPPTSRQNRIGLSEPRECGSLGRGFGVPRFSRVRARNLRTGASSDEGPTDFRSHLTIGFVAPAFVHGATCGAGAFDGAFPGRTHTVPLPAVLVADDEEDLRTFLSRFLADAGFSVHVAADGAQALELIGRVRLDAVVTDLEMPNVNGFEVVRHLRSNPRYANLGIVILSGQDDRESVERGLELGADDYLLKPFSGGELEARLKSILRRIRRCAEPENERSP